MLDHLLLNKLKWWNVDSNANQVKLNNKKWVAIPTSFTVPNMDALADSGDYARSLYTYPLISSSVYAAGYKNGKLVYWFNGHDSDNVNDGRGVDVSAFGVYADKARNVVWGG